MNYRKFASKEVVMKHIKIVFSLLAAAVAMFSGCGRSVSVGSAASELFSISGIPDGYRIRVSSSDGKVTDSLDVTGTLDRIICMSSSYVAYLAELGCDSVICGISGAKYVSNEAVRKRYIDGEIAEVGSDAVPDYEKIVSLSPDLVVAYSMPGSDFAGQLRKLGVKVLVLNDYLENAPLGRASYIRVFGALTGRMAMADSIINGIAQNYNELKDKVLDAVPADAVPGVLMNIPYADAWYVPGGTNYMSQLVSDAGAKVLGAVPGKSESSIISVEQAIILSRDASFWLNTGWCDTMEALHGQNQAFKSIDIPYIYNNTARANDRGGNDFWESGAARPDVILHDLVKIFHPEIVAHDGRELYYYKKVD